MVAPACDGGVTRVGSRNAPLNVSSALESKPAPVTAIGVGPSPTLPESGVRVESVGTWFNDETSLENSDVVLAGSVTVAETYCPKRTRGSDADMFALPVPSVVTDVLPA